MKIRSLIFITLAVLLVACQSPFPQYTSQQAIDAFAAAGLEVGEPHPMTKDDYGMAPLLAKEGTRFFLPSLCDDCGGRVMAFTKQTDLEKTKKFYDDLGQESAMLFSWTFAHSNILVQINGDLDEAQARRYETALQTLQ